MFDPVDGPGTTDALGITSITATLRRAVTVDPSTLDAGSLRDVALEVEAARRALDSISLWVLAEIDIREVADTTEGMMTGPWLAHRAGLPAPSTRDRVQIAKKLRVHLPDADVAMQEGRIGFDHARVLAKAATPRILTEFAKMVAPLIDLVPHMTFTRWQREVSAVAQLLDDDGGHQPGDDVSDNRLSISPFLDNTIILDAQLTGELALTVRDAIRTRANKLFKKFKKDAELTGDLQVPPHRTLMALALVELIREGLARDKNSSTPPQPEVSLIINADDPTDMTDSDGVPIGDTGRFSCTCDPVFHPIVMNTKGIVTDLGRSQRFASAAQRRAMAHRDGGCVWPGCDNPASWTDAHHVEHWEKGGSTDLAKLASLCRYHHGVTHRKGWTMGATPDQFFWWRSPDGTIIHSQRHQRLRGPDEIDFDPAWITDVTEAAATRDPGQKSHTARGPDPWPDPERG